MLNYKEINNIGELKKVVDVDDKHCKIPLFHGTRRYALQVADSDRERFSAACKQVLSFAHVYFNNGKIDWDKLKAYYNSSNNYYFLSTVVHQYNSTLFEYGDFYLTTSYKSAIGFAYNVGGEAGAWAYAQLKGFADWSVELDEDTKAAAAFVKQEYIKYQDSEKVILVYYGVSFDDLRTERGEPFLYKTGDEAADEQYARDDIERLYNSNHAKRNFRLANLHTYTAYVLTERMFRDGVVLFENESDVDKFIKQHNLISLEQWSF